MWRKYCYSLLCEPAEAQTSYSTCTWPPAESRRFPSRSGSPGNFSLCALLSRRLHWSVLISVISQWEDNKSRANEANPVGKLGKIKSGSDEQIIPCKRAKLLLLPNYTMLPLRKTLQFDLPNNNYDYIVVCLITGMGEVGGIKNDAKIFGFSSWKDEIPLPEKGWGRSKFGQIGNSVSHVLSLRCLNFFFFF